MANDYKVILQQDDCAPDSLEYFIEKFKELISISPSEFRHDATKEEIDNGYQTDFYLGDYKLSICADDPYWSLSIKVSE